MKELSKSYNPKEHEESIYKMWESGNFFMPDKKSLKPPYVVTIPPPNVTGSLHMGHALNNTIQDTLVRWHRMKNEPTLWVPGTDHAGIATQNVVEKKLAKEDKTRFDLGREKFIEEVWKWKEEYEARILGQLKTLGCSCDWSRTRFTMDEGYSKAVLESFVHYYEKGYLYRGNRIINWCPRCETSLSDLEVEHEERKGNLWYIRYPISDPQLPNQYIEVATTRPETMLGDTAVAVNPKDNRYKQHIGKEVVVPIANRKIPIIADDAVDKEFGTGAVKVTPAHDPLDFEISERHKIEKIIVIDPEGKMTKNAGEEFTGMDRYEAREKVIELLNKGKWLVKTDPYSHSVGHCYRCQTVIEPLLSLQWFLDMEKLAKPAIHAVEKGEIKFYPARWKKVYLNWMKNIKDWCVSRQIWWGHQLPVWYCDCGETIVTKKEPNSCPKCMSKKLTRDPDVLDTWFSSALWPLAVMGWPEGTSDMKKYYPTTLLSTARDIIYLWVARMIMSGYEFTNKKPFSDVYIHATVFNKEGKRMSKSLGTGVDPLDLIEKYGTDATRFGLLWQAAQGQDVKFSEDALLMSQRFANKIWNASRFVMMNLKNYKNVSRKAKAPTLRQESSAGVPTASTSEDRSSDQGVGDSVGKIEEQFNKDDKKILDDLKKTVATIDKYLENYDFQHASETIYEFFWHDFCDKYIELAKNRIRENAKDKVAAQYCLDYILKSSLKLLHPSMPFVTEAIWQALGEKKPLIVSSWPE